jgi:zinc/manganese transport system permease protein
MEILPFLLAPFVASLILTGIHAYLGVHVVERGVIFVDLALAQIAALGATIAILSGVDAHSVAGYWISLGFTFLGAAIFALARTRQGHIPQEAFIGIAYAVASAGSILAMSKAAGETEHLRDMLVGNILTVSWTEVGHTALLYGAIGAFHYIFRRKFLAISMHHGHADLHGVSVRFWDFLFYASFGIVVTSSGPSPASCSSSAISSFLRLAPCSLPTASARAWPSAGPWARSSPPSASISPSSSICPPAPPSSARSASCWP